MAQKTSSILIVDDDMDFASLLADVFSQASYEVEKTAEGSKAIELVRNGSFDLVVTDFRMPGMDGFELAHEIRKISPEIPIIMVSGYLEAKDRERMEKEGIVGTYEKPLSVFSLLKNAANLIAERSAASESDTNKEDTDADTASGTEFPFTALPCASKASRNFAEALYQVRTKNTNLSLIAPKGSPVQAIGENFKKWLDAENILCRICDPTECKDESFKSMIEENIRGQGRDITLFVPNLEELSPSQQKAVSRAPRMGASIDNWNGHIRLILVMGSDVETLYQQGQLSDELYLALGTSELTVPRLGECPEDITAIARHLENGDGEKFTWHPDALKLLTAEEWPSNHSGLRKTLGYIQKTATGTEILPEHVKQALHSEGESDIAKIETRQLSLRERLLHRRDSYVHGALELTENDTHAVAALLEIPVNLVEEIRR